jgi:hypothetical protein
VNGADLLEQLRSTGHRLVRLPAGIAAIPRPDPATRALLAGPDGPHLREELCTAWWAQTACDRCLEPLVGMIETGEFLCAAHGAGKEMGLVPSDKESEPMKLKVSDSAFELPEEGWHDALLAKVIEKSIVWEGQEVDRFEWHFELNGGDITIRELSSQSLSPRSKTYIWASALLDIDDELDTDDLANLPCRVKVGHKPPNANGQVFPKILEMKGPKAVAATPRAAAKANIPEPVPVGASAADDDEMPF